MKRPALPLAVRTFLLVLLPLILALGGGALVLRALIAKRVENGLRQALGQRKVELVASWERERQRLSRLAEKLAAGEQMGAVQSHLEQEDASRETIRPQVEELLRQAASMSGADLVLVSDWLGRGVAGLELAGQTKAVEGPERISVAGLSVVEVNGKLYEVATSPIRASDEAMAQFTAGRLFDIKSTGGSGRAAMLRFGKLLDSSFSDDLANEIEGQLFLNCPAAAAQCRIEAGGEPYVVLAVEREGMSADYRLLLFQSSRGVVEEFLRGFGGALTVVAFCLVLVVLAASVIGSRAVARPLARLTGRLEECGRTGRLPRDLPAGASTREINDLADAFNRAAETILHSQFAFNKGYLRFIEAMVEAVDARSPNSTGHSRRVSEYAAAIAQALRLAPEQAEIIRIGAQLHDVGKIGIPDSILQKADRLTEGERLLVEEHPEIGKRLLERVGVFEPYLPIVELHHEDFDGGGYPHGLAGAGIPLGARIVRLADAYDAMTSDRPHRHGMPHERVVQILLSCAGKQFDPELVEVFLSVLPSSEEAREAELAGLAV